MFEDRVGKKRWIRLAVGDGMMKIHFVGVGGVGMSGIAKILLEMGYKVSGSDLVRSAKISTLEKLGALIGIGHAETNMDSPDIVVISSAIPQDNVEVQWARSRGVPVISRAQMLGRLMASRTGIAVSGTHGKTTTTSMLALIATRAGMDPTVVIGGEAGDIGGNAVFGAGDLLIAEADESDASFLHLSPQTIVVTNIDADHMDYYESLDDILETFHRFLNRLPIHGTAVICTDCPNASVLAQETIRPVITYGLTGKPDVWAEDIREEGMGSSFDVYVRGVKMGRVRLLVPGRHNVLNALGATAAALHHNVPFDVVQSSLAAFHGAQRRFEVLGEKNGVLVVDDYAHHPTEIKATLAAAAALGRRVVVAFQPHRYSRTHYLADEFATAFGDADIVVLTDIYSAFERPIPGVTAEWLTDKMSQYSHVIYAGDKIAMLQELKAICKPGDLLIVMGAGDIRSVGEMYLEDSLLTSYPPLAASGRQ